MRPFELWVSGSRFGKGGIDATIDGIRLPEIRRFDRREGTLTLAGRSGWSLTVLDGTAWHGVVRDRWTLHLPTHAVRYSDGIKKEDNDAFHALGVGIESDVTKL